MTKALQFFRLLLPALAILACTACAGAGAPGPGAFTVPMESRLILQVPFYPGDEAPCAASCLAAVMTYGGRPTTVETAALALETAGHREMGRAMVIWARHESMKAGFLRGTPEQLTAAVRANTPAVVRLDRAAGPVAAGSYAVVVGYTPEGPVLNSCDVNQQITPWSDFLSAWYRADNLMMLIEPL